MMTRVQLAVTITVALLVSVCAWLLGSRDLLVAIGSGAVGAGAGVLWDVLVNRQRTP